MICTLALFVCLQLCNILPCDCSVIGRTGGHNQPGLNIFFPTGNSVYDPDWPRTTRPPATTTTTTPRIRISSEALRCADEPVKKCTCQTKDPWIGNKNTYCCKCNQPPSPTKCFPAAAKIKLQNGRLMSMSELQIGDRVQTVSSSGSVAFTEVRTFMKIQSTVMTMYKSLTTSSNTTLRLSGNHLVYARKSSSDKFYAIVADQVSTGDELLIEQNDKFTPTWITNIDNFNLQGAYVPLTMEGKIVVDGVLASCYPFYDHDLAHIGMTPIRWIPQIMEWIFGKEKGISVYVAVAEDVGKWILSHKQF